MRDPNGLETRFRVCLRLNSQTIAFHAGDGSMRRLEPTVRDVVTGEYILTQVIEASQG